MTAIADGERRIAQAQAETTKIRQQLVAIEVERMIGEAKAEAIKIQAGKWNGNLPSTVISTGDDGLKALGSFAPTLSN